MKMSEAYDRTKKLESMIADYGVARFLSVQGLQQILRSESLQIQILKTHRGPGKTQMVTDLYQEWFESVMEEQKLQPGYKEFFTGEITWRTPRNKALERFLDLDSCATTPALDPLQVGTDYRTLVEGEWSYPSKPKNNYKPHSFQPVKGEAPKSCNPNRKTVAKNRAKRKLKKK